MGSFPRIVGSECIMSNSMCFMCRRIWVEIFFVSAYHLVLGTQRKQTALSSSLLAGDLLVFIKAPSVAGRSDWHRSIFIPVKNYVKFSFYLVVCVCARTPAHTCHVLVLWMSEFVTGCRLQFISTLFFGQLSQTLVLVDLARQTDHQVSLSP